MEASKFFENLIELGCPENYLIGSPEAGMAWIEGRLSAYGIFPSEKDEPEELVEYLMTAKGLVPHRDDSLIKRDQTPAIKEKVDHKFVHTGRDVDVREKVIFFVNTYIQPLTEEEIFVVFKTRGFRLCIKRYGVSETLMNVNSMRRVMIDGTEKIACTASFPHLELLELVKSTPKELGSPKMEGNKNTAAIYSIQLLDSLRLFADYVGKISIERGISRIEEINSKHKRWKKQ